MTDQKIKNQVLQANIDFHTALSETYHEQPHYLPENRERFGTKLKELSAKAGNDLLIDFGCGTGFVIDLAVPHFNQVYGVDITPAMMSKVNMSSGKVKLLQASTEQVTLKSGVADVVACNSFLHHLWDVEPTIREAARLLKPGGVFYSEEDPNVFFWKAINEAAEIKNDQNMSDLIQREIKAVVEIDDDLGQEKHIDPEMVRLAEYQKMIKGGMDAEKLENIFNNAGFSQVSISYYWFLGQGAMQKQYGIETALKIESFLQQTLPLTRHLFKYLRVEAWK